MMNFISYIGKMTLHILYKIGESFLFICKIIANLFRFPIYLKNIMQQLLLAGYFSLPVVAMTSLFSGAVLALQSYTGFSRFSAEDSIASVVALSVTRELAPVLCGLMVAGRVGASIAAEIGTMKVTEQIDALSTLQTDPIKYLLVPRVVALIIAMPILVLIGDVIGILGGYIIAIYKLEFNAIHYINNTIDFLEFIDVFSGVVKAGFFGLIISITSCYYGFNTSKGAKGVGISVTKAVVNSSIFILISNYFITALFF